MAPIPIVQQVLLIIIHLPTTTTSHLPALTTRSWPPCSIPLGHNILGMPCSFVKPSTHPTILQSPFPVFIGWISAAIASIIFFSFILAHIKPRLPQLCKTIVRDCCHHGDTDDEKYTPPKHLKYGITALPEHRVPHDLSSSGGGPNRAPDGSLQTPQYQGSLSRCIITEPHHELNHNEDPPYPRSDYNPPRFPPSMAISRSALGLPRRSPRPYYLFLTSAEIRRIHAARKARARAARYAFFDGIMWPGFSRQVFGADAEALSPAEAATAATRRGIDIGAGSVRGRRRRSVQGGCGW